MSRRWAKIKVGKSQITTLKNITKQNIQEFNWFVFPKATNSILVQQNEKKKNEKSRESKNRDTRKSSKSVTMPWSKQVPIS